MKWEVTRRHPYYAEFWEVAARHLRSPSADPAARDFGEWAVALLRLIGVTDVPPPPGTSFADLGGTDMGRVWAGGAIAPATFRTLITFLLLGLPAEVCAAVGKFLTDYASATELGPEDKQDCALDFLYRLAGRYPVLNSYVDAPFVAINTDASFQAIQEAVRDHVARFKARRNVPETKRRDDVLDDYLAVWDRREGWTGDRYDCAREQTLSAIARTLGIPVRTVQNRYTSAFRLIVGREYTPELWTAVVGRYKWSLLTAGMKLPSVSSRRPRRTKQPRPVPETTLSGRDDGEGRGFTVDPGVESDTDEAMLRADIHALIADGRTNSEIRAELGLTDDRSDAVIDYFRTRRDESV
jgi:hypothetical protein